MDNKKNKILIWASILAFGAAGIYFTFIAGNTDKYDSQTKAYQINPNESYNSDDGTIYNPVYHFIVDGKEYICRARSSSTYPKESKNTVYYDSTNPENCKTEYDKSTSRLAGIVCLIATVAIVYFFVIKKPSDSQNDYNHGISEQYQDEETQKKVVEMVEKVQLIIKRVILGIIIAILLVLVLIDTVLFKQTMTAKDYIETTAYVSRKSDEYSNAFDNYIYTFEDTQGRQQEITISTSKNGTVEDTIKIKYNADNPQDFYEESAMLDKQGIIWYIVKIVAIIILVILFFNRRLLNKIGVSVRS